MNRSKTTTANQVVKLLKEQADPEKAARFPNFFRSGPGEYGEGDQFLGVVAPKQHGIAKDCTDAPLIEIGKLLDHAIHECRQTALFILVLQYQKAKDDPTRKQIYDFYVSKVDRVNNWDLVDSSCYKIMGPQLLDGSHQPLIRFAKANHLWKNRIAIVTTFYFIKRGYLRTTIGSVPIIVES